jgi:hypothetical protein
MMTARSLLLVFLLYIPAATAAKGKLTGAPSLKMSPDQLPGVEAMVARANADGRIALHLPGPRWRYLGTLARTPGEWGTPAAQATRNIVARIRGRRTHTRFDVQLHPTVKAGESRLLNFTNGKYFFSVDVRKPFEGSK